MKNNGMVFWLAMVLIIPCPASAIDNRLEEKNSALKHLVYLQAQLTAKRKAHLLALRNTLSDEDKKQLKDTYGNDRRQLLQEIAQQEKTIEDLTNWSEKWGWSVAKTTGVVALAGFALYSYLVTPQVKINNVGSPLLNNSINLIAEKEVGTKTPQNSWINKAYTSWSKEFFKPLTKEEIQQYKKRRNAYALTAVAYGGLGVMDPLMLPYFLSWAAYFAFMGAAHHVKTFPEGKPAPTILGDIYPH